MKGIFKEIKEVSDQIKNGRTGLDIYLSIAEETGELAQEINVKYSKCSYKKADVDGILGETCDVILGAVDLLIIEGYTEEEVMEVIKKKSQKWLSKAGTKF